MKWLQMNSWIRFGLILLFGLCITTPPVATILMPRQNVSKLENRKLAEFPECRGADIRNFPIRFERYFKDHIGFRDLLTVLYNRAMVVWFQQSPNPFFSLGKDGWLFISSEQSMDDVLGKAALEPEMLQQWGWMLQGRKDWLAKQGIRYLFVIAPDKQSIYPEYLPDAIRRRAARTKRIDQLTAYLKAHTTVPVLDLRPALLAAKSAGRQIYFRSDSHWNSEAGWIAYQQIMDVVTGWFPDLQRLDPSRVVQVQRPFVRGDIATRLGMGDFFREQETAFWVPASCVTSVKPIFNEVSHWKHCPSGSHRVIVARDSFFVFIEPYVSETFREATFIWKESPATTSYDYPLIKRLIREDKPDLVIEERVERFLGAGPEMSLEEQFDQASAACVLDAVHGFQGLEGVHDVKVVSGSRGLGIHATSGDPWLLLRIDEPKPGPVIVRIQMESPVDTKMQVFYRTDDRSGYAERNSFWYPLTKGMNTVYVLLEKSQMLRYLRIDPGTAEGLYVLERIEVRSLHPDPDASISFDGTHRATP